VENLYSSPNVVMVDQMKEGEMGGTCSMHRKNEKYILIAKHVGKRPLRKHRHMWENNIKNGSKKIALEGVDQIELTQDGVQW